MLPKGILFDLDDTIIAFDASADPTWRRVCQDGARRLQPVSPGVLYDTIGRARRWFWDDPDRHRSGRLSLNAARRRVVEHAFAELGLTDTGMAHEIADAYSARREEAIEIFPGAKDTLA